MIELIRQIAKVDVHTGQEDYFGKLLKLLCEYLRFESAIAISTIDTPSIIATRKLDKKQTDGLFNLIIESKVAATITHINETLPPPWGEISRYHFRNLLSLPLGTRNNLLGYVGLLSKNRHTIDDEEYKHLETLTQVINMGYSLNKNFIDGLAKEKSDTRSYDFAEILPNGFIVCDTQGRIIYVNQSLVDFLGSPSREQTRMINLLTFPPLVNSGISDSLRKALETKSVATSVHTYKSKWGKTIHARLELVPIIDEQGEIRGVQGQVFDITDERKLVLLHESINSILSTLFGSNSINDGLSLIAKQTRNALEAGLVLITKNNSSSGSHELICFDCADESGHIAEEIEKTQDLTDTSIETICMGLAPDDYSIDGVNANNHLLIESDIKTSGEIWGSLHIAFCNLNARWESTHQTILDRLCGVIGSFIHSMDSKNLYLESERKKALILEAFPDSQYIISHDAKIISVPNEKTSSPDCKLNLMVGDKFTQILNETDERVFIDTITQAAVDGNLWHMEFELDEKHSNREIECKIIPHSCDELLLCVREITNKNSNGTLQNNRDKMTEIITKIPDILVIFDMHDEKIMLISKGAERFLGVSGEELIGKEGSELERLIEVKNRDFLVEKLLCREPLENVKIPFKMKSGMELTTLVSADYINIDGKQCVLFSARDISEIEKSEAILKKHMDRYKHLTENAPIGIAIANADGKITEINPAAVSVCGKLLEFMGTGEMPDVSNLQKLIQDEISVALTGKKLSKIIEVSGKDNDSEHLRFSLAPMCDKNNDVTGVMIMFEDVSEIQNSISKINQAQQDAIKAGLAKNEFLANMSHEIRTPLNALLGFTQLLKNEDASDRIRDYVDSINTAGEALNFLTSDLLDVTRIEADKFSLYLEPSNLLSTFEQVRTILSHRIEDSGNEVTLNISNDDKNKLYLFDSSRLKQVLINLLGNSLKFTSNGKITVDILISKINDKTDNITIIIDDTGIGIPKTMHELVFQPFTQIDSSSTKKFAGSGLGLAIVKGIINAMGGNISIEAKDSPGARFRIEIPFEAAGDIESCDNGTNPFDDDRLRGINVLVAEDNSLNVKLISEILKNLGCSVTVCTTGQGVVEHAQDKHYDVCLMDIQMPDLSGLDATMQIRYFEEKNDSGHLPIIAMTAYASISDRDKCLKAGMDSYIAKPIKIPELIKAVCSTANIGSQSQIEKLSRQLAIDPQKLTEILTEYATNGIESLNDIESQIESGEWREICDVCHKLKGMAYMEPVTSLVSGMHTCAKEQDKTGTQEHASKLVVAYEDMLSQLTKN